MLKEIVFNLFIVIGVSLIALSSSAAELRSFLPEHVVARLSADKFQQIQQDDRNYYIVVSSIFKDVIEKQNLLLLAKAELYYFLREFDEKLAGIEFSASKLEYFEDTSRLFLVVEINKNRVIKNYNTKDTEKHLILIMESIERLEKSRNKNRLVYEQLKDLYLIIGDFDGYDKASSLLIEAIQTEE